MIRDDLLHLSAVANSITSQLKIRQIRIYTQNAIFSLKWAETTLYCEISGRIQMPKTIIAVKHFALGDRESLETDVKAQCHLLNDVM